ncbi:MAG TPA: hypothetical protein VF168_14535 [Trueperaceae bacterium]
MKQDMQNSGGDAEVEMQAPSQLTKSFLLAALLALFGFVQGQIETYDDVYNYYYRTAQWSTEATEVATEGHVVLQNSSNVSLSDLDQATVAKIIVLRAEANELIAESDVVVDFLMEGTEYTELDNSLLYATLARRLQIEVFEEIFNKLPDGLTEEEFDDLSRDARLWQNIGDLWLRLQ